MSQPEQWQWLNYPDGRKLLTGPTEAIIHCSGPGPAMGVSAANQAKIAAVPQLINALERLVAKYAFLKCDHPHGTCEETGCAGHEWSLGKAALAAAKNGEAKP